MTRIACKTMSFGEATNLLLAMTDDEDKIRSKSGVVSMKIEQMEGSIVAFITKRMFAPDAKVHSIWSWIFESAETSKHSSNNMRKEYSFVGSIVKTDGEHLTGPKITRA